MLVAGLTGTSGSGKGYVSALMAGDDVCIVDTDRVYHEMISAPSPCVSALVDAFGDSILSDSKGINRKALAAIVFSDKEKLKLLNTITHAFILDECRRIINEAKKAGKWLTVIDAPLLFEAGFDAECDVTIGVTAPVDIRIKRIIQRDSITREQAEARINNQKPDAYFESNCDHVIFNDSENVKLQVKELMLKLKRLYGEKKTKEEV